MARRRIEVTTRDGTIVGAATASERGRAGRLRRRKRLAAADRAWLRQYDLERRLYREARVVARKGPRGLSAADLAHWRRHAAREAPIRPVAPPTRSPGHLAKRLARYLTGAPQRAVSVTPGQSGRQNTWTVELPPGMASPELRQRLAERYPTGVALGPEGQGRVGVRVEIFGPDRKRIGWRTLVPYTSPDRFDWGFVDDAWADFEDRYGVSGAGAVQVYS